MPEMRPYRPSNSDEGGGFQAKFCDHCERDRAAIIDDDYENGCPILARALMYGLKDPEYPKEWQEPVGDIWNPICTAYEPLAENPPPFVDSAQIQIPL